MRWLVALTFLFLGILAHADEPDRRVYVFSVVPQLPVIDSHRDWAPVLDQISQQTGMKFRLRLSESIPEFETELLLGKYDFAYANPFHVVMAQRQHQYRPLLRDNARKLTGILVVREDSPYQTLSDLNGTEIAFPSPNAFAASLYLRYMLHQAGLSFEPRYAESHSNTLRYVLLGKASAGGVVIHTLEKQRAEALDNLRILYETPELIPHAVIVKESVPATVTEKFLRAFLQLSQTVDGRRLLDAISMPAPVATRYDEYRPLESMQFQYNLQIHRYQSNN